MSYKGSCMCKSIHLEFEGEPENVIACHCLDCQKSAGGPFQISAFYPTSKMQVTDPNNYLKKFVVPKEKVSSGFEKHKFFCGNCGSHLYNQPMKANGTRTVLKTSILDGPEGGDPGINLFRPTFEFFVKDRASFLSPLEGAEQCEKGFNK